jgi:hypothetical protein
MLWHTSIAPQWLAPRGEFAMTCAGRPGIRAGGDYHRNLGRWRS